MALDGEPTLTQGPGLGTKNLPPSPTEMENPDSETGSVFGLSTPLL